MEDGFNLDDINKKNFSEASERKVYRNDLLILIVEDQKFSRLMLKNFLAKTYDVVAVEDGESALIEYIAKAPDIVFLDIDLPGVGGHRVAELLQKLDESAYIVMVTANNYVTDVEKAQKHGVKGFIVKPFTKDNIFEHIEKYIQQQGSRS